MIIKKTNIKSGIFKNFVLKTTIHGFKNIKDAEYLFAKVLWIICFTISASLCFYSIISAVVGYLNFDVVTKIRSINEKQSIFPTVSICNQNIFTSKFAYYYLRNYSIFENNRLLFENLDKAKKNEKSKRKHISNIG